MKIGILGAGNLGTAFATRPAKNGHEVAIAAKNPGNAAKAAAAAGGNARAVKPNEVASGADVLLLATPYGAAVESLRAAGNLGGKRVVDISNPLKLDMSGLSLGHTAAAADEIQRAVPDAKVVKTFNAVFAQALGGAAKAQVFYAGDDAAAKETVRGLVERVGLEAVDAGPLANARHLEPVRLLNISFGYVAGRGTAAAPAWGKVG